VAHVKELLNPTNFDILVSNLGDVLVKALDQPLGYAINWGENLVVVACASGNRLL
jgi:hypothetical protein